MNKFLVYNSPKIYAAHNSLNKLRKKLNEIKETKKTKMSIQKNKTKWDKYNLPSAFPSSF